MGNLQNPEPFFDWLSFTLPYNKNSFSYLEFFGKKEVELDKGKFGYSVSYFTKEKALIAYSPEKKQNRILCSLSASSLSALDDLGVKPEEIILPAIEAGAKFTRVDLTKDDYLGILNLDLISKKIQSGETASRLRQYQIFSKETNAEIQSGKLKPGQEIGRTIYLGDFESGKVLIRIYDKAAQTKEKKHWIRVEYQLRKEAADQFLNPGSFIDPQTGELRKNSKSVRIKTKSYLDRSFRKTFLYYLRFLDPAYKKEAFDEFSFLEPIHKRHWPTSQFWTEFLGTKRQEKIGLPKYKNGLEDLRNWFGRSMSGLTYLLKESDPKSFERLIKYQGKKNFENNKHYKKLLEGNEK